MKRLITMIILTLSISLLVVGCGSNKDESSNNNASTNTKTEKTTVTKKEDPKSNSMDDILKSKLDVVSINNDEGSLYVKYKFKDTLSCDSMVNGALLDIKSVLNDLKDNEEFKKLLTITFVGMGKATDGKDMAALTDTFEINQLENTKDFNAITNQQLIQLQGDNRTGTAPGFRSQLSDETIQIIYPN